MSIINSPENAACVFPFKKYDIGTDCYIVSRRYATATTIERVHGIICGTSATVDAKTLDQNGFTDLDFNPYERS